MSVGNENRFSSVRRWLAGLQVLIGVAALVVVGVTWGRYSEKSQVALEELDGMAGHAEAEMEIAVSLLHDFDGLLGDVEGAIPAYEASLDSSIGSTRAVAGAMGAWGSELGHFAEIAEQTSGTIDGFAAQLPLPLPQVSTSTDTLKFQVPELNPDSEPRKVTLSYKSPSGVKTGEKTVSVPSGLSVKSFRDVEITRRDFSIPYPESLTFKEEKQTVEIPNPTYRLVDHKVEVPKIQVTNGKVMEKEKALLEKTSQRLVSVSASLEKTQGTLAGVEELLAGETVRSLQTTRSQLQSAGETLTTIRSERIPGVVHRLESQREQLHSSREIFGTLKGLLPLLFLFAALVSLAIVVSGVGKWVAVRGR